MKPIDKDKLVKKPSANGGKPVVNTPHKTSFKENHAKNQVFGASKHPKKNNKKNKKKDGMPVPIKIGAGVAAASIAVGVVGYALTNNHSNNQNSESSKSNGQSDNGFDKSNDSDNDGLNKKKDNKKNNSKGKDSKKNSKKKDGKGTDLLNDLLTESGSSSHSKSSKGTSSDELGSLIKSMSKDGSSDNSKGGSSLKQLAKKAAQSKESAEILGTSKDKGGNSSKSNGKGKENSSSGNELQQLANKNKAAENKESSSNARIPGQPNGTAKGESTGSHSGQPTKASSNEKGNSSSGSNHTSQPTKTPSHGGTTSNTTGQSTKAPDHGGSTGGTTGQPTKTPNHGGETGGTTGQSTKAPDHGGSTGSTTGQPTKTPNHGGETGGTTGQPTKPNHGGETGGTTGQPTKPNHSGETGGTTGQPTTPDHGGETGGTTGQPTKPNHDGETGGTTGQPTKPNHGGETGGTTGQPTTPDHGGETGGTTGQPTTPDQGGETGGTTGQPTTPDQGGETGGTAGQPTTPDHGDTTGNDSGQPVNPDHGGSTGTSDDNKPTPVISTIHASISSDGTVVSGTTDPNTTINVVNESDGGTLGTTSSDDSGQYSVNLSQPVTNGEKLNIIATKDGYKSLSTDLTAPTITPTIPDHGGSTGTSDDNKPTPVISTIHAGINSDGTVVSGTTDPNTTINIIDESNGGTLGTGESDDSGQFSVALDTPATDGQKLNVIASKDGYKSLSTDFSAPKVNNEKVISTLRASINSDGSVISGTTDPNATVNVVDETTGNTLGTTTSDDSGQFSVTLNQPATDGQSLDINVTKDGYKDLTSSLTAPQVEKVVTTLHAGINSDGTVVSGNTDPNVSISIVDQASGQTLGSGESDDSGQFSVTLDTPATNGQSLSINATKNGYKGLSATLNAPTVTTPSTPDQGGSTGNDDNTPTNPDHDESNGDNDNQQDQVITTLRAGINSDGTVVSGTTDPNTTVNVVDESNGGTLGTTTSDDSGQFNLTLGQPATNGQKLSVIASKDGYKSLTVEFNAPTVTSTPKEQSILNQVQISSDGTSITGISNPNSEITATLNGETVGSATTDDSGNFSLTLSTKPNNGDVIHITSTGNGVDSVSGDVTAQVSTSQPSLPDNISFKCYTSDGTYIGDGSAVKQSNGSYEIHTPSGYVPQNNQDVLNNTGRIIVVPSQQGQATFLNKVGFNADGNTISGVTNPNVTVTFTSNGSTLGTTTSDNSGNFSFSLPNALTHGETVQVTADDVSVNATAPSSPYAGVPDGSRQDVQFITSDGQVVGNGYLVKENGGVTLHNIPGGYKLSDEDAEGHSAQLMNWPKTINVVPDSSVSNA